MGKLDGAKVLLKVGTATFTGILSSTFDYSVDVIETTTKDSNGHKEKIAGEDSGSFSVSALYDPAGTYSLNEIFTAAKAKAAVTVVMGGTTAGDETVTASCIITSVSWGAPKNEASTVDASFETTGEITVGTVGA